MKMTDEYAAQHFHKMGWMWGRLEVMKEKETWGDLHDNYIEKELREKIAQEIIEKRKPYAKLAWEKDGEERQFYLGICEGINFAIAIARGNNDSD